MGPKEKETFAMALSAIKWEPLYILETCKEQYAYYKTIIDKLMQYVFSNKGGIPPYLGQTVDHG